MGATRFLKDYTQETCEKSLNEGYSVGFLGSIPPETDKIKIPHEVQEVKVDGKTIGFNINKIYSSTKKNHYDSKI